MEEILQLKQYMTESRYSEAFLLVEEMEEMAKDDKITRISSYSVILLIHLIKREAEQRTTRSWNLSIEEALDKIHDSNARRKAHRMYLNDSELREVLATKYPHALRRAAAETLEGSLDAKQLDVRVDRAIVLDKAMNLICTYQPLG